LAEESPAIIDLDSKVLAAAGMNAAEQLREMLSSRGLTLASDIIPNPIVQGGYFVPLTIKREGRSQIPSGKTLGGIREQAAGLGLTIEFLLTDENARQVEEGLRASFLNSFPQLVRNSFLSVEGGKAVVWIENKKEISREDFLRLEAHARTYASLFSLRGVVLHVTSESNLATSTVILTIVRRHAPAKCEDVRDALLASNFAVPSLEWINRRFDALRRSGLLIRMPDRSYALTLEALGSVLNWV
jgi:hypothetical protein